MRSNELILMFIRNLSLADHMGDVADDVDAVLKILGISDRIGEWHDLDQLGDELDRLGVRYMHEIGNYNATRVDDPPNLPPPY